MFQLKRRPSFLSYSSISLFESQPEEFFLRYLAGNRAPRLPQENYMSVGSGFDAYVKSALHEVLFGKGADPQFEFTTLFEEQVEAHNRDFTLSAGKYLFECYKLTGAYDELLALLQQAVEDPQFESKVDGKINGVVPVTGKPDLRWIMQFKGCDRLRIVLDWKVKGFCSKHGASPSKGYALCRDAYKVPEGKKQSQSHMTEHKNYLAMNHRGLTINAGFMEHCNEDYADQVSMYGWLLGEEVGDDNTVVWIDELVSKYLGEGVNPLERVANHRARVSKAHQEKLYARILKCHEAVQSGHVFTDMSREDSDARCEVLDQTAVGLQSGSAADDWYNAVARPQRNF